MDLPPSSFQPLTPELRARLRNIPVVSGAELLDGWGGFAVFGPQLKRWWRAPPSPSTDSHTDSRP